MRLNGWVCEHGDCWRPFGRTVEMKDRNGVKAERGIWRQRGTAELAQREGRATAQQLNRGVGSRWALWAEVYYYSVSVG